MEDGQKRVIPLTSTINVNTSDKLVNIDTPTFKHNRQKFLNNSLSSSVRFEYDGFAVGDDVCQFNIIEDFLKYGSIVVTKQNINKNPTYKFYFRDTETGKDIGSFIYNPISKVISYDTETCLVDNSVNPSVFGTINGKHFELAYNSITKQFTNNSDEYISFDFNMKNDYSAEITLKDTSPDASVSITFTGMQLPSNTITNDGYTIGTFQCFRNGVHKWVSNKYAILLDNDIFKIVDNNNTEIVTKNIIVAADGSINTSLDIPVIFKDVLNIQTTEFFPFLTDIDTNTIGSTIHMQANSSIIFNRFQHSITDRAHTDYLNSDKLYRNNFEQHLDYNKQTVEQTIPMWFGITAKPGFTQVIPDQAYLLKDAGDTIVGPFSRLGSNDAFLCADPNSSVHSNNAGTFTIKATEEVKLYSISCQRPDIHIWENDYDAINDTNRNIINFNDRKKISITIAYVIKRWVDTYDGENLGSHNWELQTLPEETYTFDINTTPFDTGYTNLTPDNIKEMFISNYPDTLYITNVVVHDSLKTYNLNLSSSAFYKSGTPYVQISDSQARISLNNLKLKGEIDLSSDNISYLKQLQTDENHTTAFYSSCINGMIATNIYIAENVLLTNKVDKTAFMLEPTAISDNSYVDLSNLFEHKILNASLIDSLNIQLGLCAKEKTQHLFYSQGGGTNTSYAPGHIITGDIKQVNSDNIGGMLSIIVHKEYTSTDFINAIIINITGNPVRTNNKPFNFIKSISTELIQTSVLDNNNFSKNTINVISDQLSYSLSNIEGYVDLNIPNNANRSLYTDSTVFLKDYKQKIQMLLNGTILCSAEYYLNNTLFNIQDTFEFDGYSISAASVLDSEDIKYAYILFTTSVQYNLNFYVPKVYDEESFMLRSFEDNTAVIRDTANKYQITIDFDTQQCLLQYIVNNTLSKAYECNEIWGVNNDVTIFSEYLRKIIIVLNGVYSEKNVVINSISDTISVTINNNTFNLDVNNLINSNQRSKMEYNYIKVNKEEISPVKFAEVYTDNEMQFLKQQWDTTDDTECFWWLDSSHILLLTKHEFIIREKTDEVSQWDGDKFIDTQHIQRTNIITSDILKYFCSSAYGEQYARFITISADSDINIHIYDNMVKHNVNVSLIKRAIGEYLCPDNRNMYTYSDLQLSSFITMSKWSATCIDDILIIGVHFDNNFNQWAIIVDLKNYTIQKIIQGYGFVGVNGCLTGGEIPEKFFSIDKGFNSIVYPIESLSDTSTELKNLNDLFVFNDRVVGSDSQQWYISKNVSSIVSHIEYVNGDFIVRELPLNNNYSVNYDSASFASAVVSDESLKIKPLNDLTQKNNAAWTAMLVLWTYPILYYLNPSLTTINYLQQTLGQAAFVHYNNSNVIKQKDEYNKSLLRNYSNSEAEEYLKRAKEISVISSDEISFDRQSIKQEQTIDNVYDNLFLVFASVSISALDWAKSNVSFSKENGLNASDFGQLGQFTMQNFNSLAISKMGTKSVNPTLISEVTAVKTLDMFYSTSDSQEIHAGPGYVNHNFIAQCISQSTTIMQSEIVQQKTLFLISALTMLPIQQLNKALLSARRAVEKQLESMAGPGFAGTATTYTTPAAIALGIAYAALDIACNITQIGLEVLPRMLESLGSDKFQTYITANQSNNIPDIESKHRYGNKSECFMWPCFGIQQAKTISDESVEVIAQNKSWKLSLDDEGNINNYRIIQMSHPNSVTKANSDDVVYRYHGDVSYFISMIKGKSKQVTLPNDMAYVIGAESILPQIDFKNENIGEDYPVFSVAPFQDYIIDKYWQISQTASDGMTVWISCKDTKIIDGELSNIVISNDFCGIASPYTAIEVKHNIDRRYIRPQLVTPQVLSLNNTGLNCVFEDKAYHAFDGYGYRIIEWLGAPGMGKNFLTHIYTFLKNDRFKRSNILPHNTFSGNFTSDPVIGISGDYNDQVFNLVTQPGNNKGLTSGAIGEDKDVRRYAIPVFFEPIDLLPAAIKTISTQMLSVIDGITSLTTANRDLQSLYKAPKSVDFTIGKNKYRYTEEYICSITDNNTYGVTVLEHLVPCLGMDFVGSTPYEAYLYSKDTKQYYIFTGGSSMQLVSLVERFKSLKAGCYDFINQEIILPFSDFTDNTCVLRLKDRLFTGEIWPPINTIYNADSGFKVYSIPAGVLYQGPNRCIINRFNIQEYMLTQIKSNFGKWKRLPRERAEFNRVYRYIFKDVTEYAGDNDLTVNGWTHNPFLLVTSPLGINEHIDCLFEWEVVFYWSKYMDDFYGYDKYAVVNLQAITYTDGGMKISERPVHIFLKKELFNKGYYSFKFQSNNGAGNREQLFMWSDQYICVTSLQTDYKQITQKRTEALTQQVDIVNCSEL